MSGQYRYMVGKITTDGEKKYIRQIHIDGIDHLLPSMTKGEKITIDGIPIEFDGANYIARWKNVVLYC